MKIKLIKLPFTKKSVLFVCFFACMFVFASFTRKDKDRITQWKKSWKKEKGNKTESLSNQTTDFSLLNQLSYGNPSFKRLPSEPIAGSDLNPEIIDVGNSDAEINFPVKEITESTNNSSYFPAIEKEGTIGVFSDTEQDRASDNFFTINLPKIDAQDSRVFLTYELYGLASHESVSRSLNHQLAIGGEIIIPSAVWSEQKEELSLSLLKEGINSVLFTSPATGIKYKVRNLKIVFEKNKKRERDYGISSVLSGDNLYVKGRSSDNHVRINNSDVLWNHGEFEKVVKLSVEEKASGQFSFVHNGNTEYLKIPKDQKSFKVIGNSIYDYNTITIANNQELDVNYEDLHLKAEKDAAESASIEIIKLREKDIPAVSGGLKNLTPANSGYRFSLKSGKLNKKVKITIPYDEKKLGLFSPKEIQVFAFDYNRKKWKSVESAVVDQQLKTVTFEGDGDGDYINGVISVPESPQLNSFTPTTIRGLKAANPVGAPLMQAPSANQSGDANVNYPLTLPAGVSGMQPSLSVSYNSSSNGGWMGEGWNISGLSSISVDTRWGTPAFATGQETELYAIDGEMLVYPEGYLPHRHNKVNPDGTFDTARQTRNGSGSKTFYLRRNHNFTKIERFGTDTKNYRWVVTSTSGTRTYYGGDESTLNTNAVLKNYNQDIIQWAIWKVEDVHGNNIIYEYKNQELTSFTGDDQNLNNGKIFHIDTIYYTGRNGQKGPYMVTFVNDTARPDKRIDAKGILKKIEPYLLSKINVEYKNGNNPPQNIRSYEFSYMTGIFQKSLLRNMKLQLPTDSTDGSGDAFNYSFEYHGDNGFFPATNLVTPGTDAFSDVVSSITTPSKVSADNNFEWGWSLRTGGGLSLFRPQTGGVKNFMLSLFGGASYPRMKRGQELVDFNGDGIADILYRKRNGSNGIMLIPGSLDDQGHLTFNNSSYQSVGNLNSNFTHSTGTTWNLGGSVVFNWFKMGFDFSYINSESENETPIYMMDANSDGLPDVVKDDKVWFNRKNGDVQEIVTTSDLTENMVITDNDPQPYTEPEDPDDEDPVKPKNDVVKVWIAPKNGYIEISDEVAMATGQDASAKAVYSIEIKNPDVASKNCRLFLTELNSTVSQSISITNYNPAVPLGASSSSKIYVKSGEKVYFRLHKRSGENYIVNTRPMVRYTDSHGDVLDDNLVEEQDGFMPNQTNYDEKFFLNNLTKSFKLTEPAKLHITAPAFTISSLSDRVKYSIVLVKEDASVAQNQQTTINVIYEETVGPNSGLPVAVAPVDLNYSVPALSNANEAWHLKFLVETDSHINKEIEWNDIIVEGYPDASYKHYAVAEYPSYHIRDLKNKFDISTVSNVPAGNDDYFISINKNFSFTPSVSGRFMYVIKKNGVFLDKRIVEIMNGTLKEYTIDYTPITGTSPISFYTGNPTAGLSDNEKLNILIFCDTNKDRLAYEALKLQLSNNIFTIYNQAGSSVLNYTTETSINTGEYNGVTAVYHNWGQFLYNEARDIVPAAGSTSQQPAIDPNCEVTTDHNCYTVPTAPSTSTSPAYTINTNTPKDQYGALINDSTLENPFQFNLDFPACAGITDPQLYGECMGDQLSNDFQNNYANNQVFGAASPFTPLNPTKTRDIRESKWINQLFKEQYSKRGSFRDDETPTSPFIDNDTDADDIEVANNPNTKMFAISKKQKSKSKTKNAGIGFGLSLTNSTSQLRSYGNIQTQDFFDVNGDNYPDILYAGQSQVTGILGGLKAAQSGIEGGYKVITKTEDFMNTKSIAFGPSGSKSVGRFSPVIGDTSVSWSMSVGSSDYPNSYNKTKEYWIDINGDGLLDKIEGNNYKLNFGTGYVNGSIPGSAGSYAGFEEPVSKPVRSTSFGIGGGINGVIDAVQGVELGIAVSGGIGGGNSTATAKSSFLDINGDGLVDIVLTDENTGQTSVKYNLGNRFANAEGINVSLAEESKTHSGYANLNGGYYINIPAITIWGVTLLYIKPFGADLTANVGLSVSEMNKGFRDVNGDGFGDILVNDSGGLKVHYSANGKANKLKTVYYSESHAGAPAVNLGAAFNIDYNYSRPSYNDPNAKLVMSEVMIPNPDAFSGTYTFSTYNKDIITRFEYENSRYDRREREKYGFEKVKTYEMSSSSAVYRTTVQTFYNQNYFVRGLLRSVETYGDSGTSNLLSATYNNYKLYNFNSAYTELVEVPAGQFLTYDIGGTEGRKMGRVLLSDTTKKTYENGNSISTLNEMFYNVKGQLTKYQYTSPSTSYNSVIAYHTNINNNIQNVPSMITVYSGTGNTNAVRKRATEISDFNTGDISKIKVWLSAGEIAETEFTYDPFGNIKTVKYPPNENNQRSELEYIYDPTGKYMIQVKDPIFNLSSYASYDPLLDTILESTDVAGNKMGYTYDGYGRPLTVISPNDWQAQINTITYDYFNSPAPMSNGFPRYLFAAKTSHYDPYHPGNNIETISFADVTGEVIQVKKDIEIDNQEKMSVSGKAVKDNLGRAVWQYHPVSENKDATINNKLTLTLATDLTTASYDFKNRVVSSTDELGNSINTKYYIFNNRFETETTQAQSNTAQIRTEVFANAEGKTVEKINYLSGQALTTVFSYSPIGELMQVIDPEGLESNYSYDMGGRKVAHLHPDRGETLYTYSKAGQLTYVLSNNLNMNGGVPIHYLYSYNRLTNIKLPDIPSGTNPANVWYGYGTSGNNAGRIVAKQDGTGISSYEYGKMGEVTNEFRSIYGFYMPTLGFNTSYQYDNWNRIRTITYPDNELVYYEYDLGGNLKKIGNEAGYEYVKSIKYDKYEERTNIVFGNNTSSSFIYEQGTRRLQNHVLQDANSVQILNGTYKYDLVGNILKIENNGQTTDPGFGGEYTFNYEYDTLNRLVKSSGNALPQIREGQPPIPIVSNITSMFNTSLSYNMSSGIASKTQYHSQDGVINQNNTYDNTYSYIDGTHMVERIIDSSTGAEDYFKYDGDGNAINHTTNQTGPTDLYWDEQDRLRAVHTPETGSFQYYVYDDKGERTIKADLQNDTELYQNGEMVNNGYVLDNFKVYPNPYVVYNAEGMLTKHYFAGSQRIASRLVDVGTIFTTTTTTTTTKQSTSSGNKDGGDPQSVAENGFKSYLSKAGFNSDEVEKEFARTLNTLNTNDAVYFLHGDHLGTATFVTNEVGEATQFFLNLPFGETMVEQQEPTSYVNPYKFNSKELDSETGFYYYGARYYNPRISIWYGVDPLAERTPSWNPYVYAFNNPIRYVDPTGMANEDWVRLKDGRTIYDSRITTQGEAETAYGKGAEYRPVGFTYTATTDGNTYQLGDHGFYLKNGSEVGLSEDYAKYAQDQSGKMITQGLALMGTTMTLSGGPENPAGDAAAAGEAVVYGVGALIAKMTYEMSKIDDRPEGPSGWQYSLKATADGEYPVMTSGNPLPTSYIHLNMGDIWKYGETTSPERYMPGELNTKGPGVIQHNEFSGTQRQIKMMEKSKIYNYFFQNGKLPPGNKIFR